MSKEKIFIGADSAGYALKGELITYLGEAGYEVVDCGTDSDASCHYPIYAAAVSRAVLAEAGSLGILVCGTGIGMSITANKFDGIRASVCGDTFSARMTRMHNDANVLCIGARVVGSGLAKDICDAFLSAEFEGGRHAVRVDMITEIEKNRK